MSQRTNREKRETAAAKEDEKQTEVPPFELWLGNIWESDVALGRSQLEQYPVK